MKHYLVNSTYHVGMHGYDHLSIVAAEDYNEANKKVKDDLL